MNTRNFWKTIFAAGALALATGSANAQYVFGPTNPGRIVDLSAGVYGPPVVVGPNGAQSYYPNPYGYSPYGAYSNYNPYAYNPYYGSGAGYYNPYTAFVPDNYSGYGGYVGYPVVSQSPVAPTEVNPTVDGVPANGAVVQNTVPTVATPVATATRRVLPRTSDSIDAHRVRGDRFYIGWTGENSAVNKITFAMLDLNKRPIMTRTVTQAPGEYTFPITSRMVYYQAVVEYVNGTTTTVTSPL